MAVFGNLELEGIVQTNDRTRLSAIKSFVSKDSAAISKVRIKPSASDSFIDCGNKQNEWFIDWEYTSNGIKTVTLEVTIGTGMSEVVTEFTKTIEVLSPSQDKLFSADSDLIKFEPDILKWLPAGKNTFNNIHRNAQALILDWLDNIRLYKEDGSKLTKEDLSLTDDLKQLSIYMTLELIFTGISNKVDDMFLQKARLYSNKATSVQGRGRIQADFNGNGTLESTEKADMRSIPMVRR